MAYTTPSKGGYQKLQKVNTKRPPIDMSTCPRCGQPAKYFEGGVSKKTGRPYDAFYVCQDTVPCQTTWADGSEHNLTWKSAKQYVWLQNNGG